MITEDKRTFMEQIINGDENLRKNLEDSTRYNITKMGISEFDCITLYNQLNIHSWHEPTTDNLHKILKFVNNESPEILLFTNDFINNLLYSKYITYFSRPSQDKPNYYKDFGAIDYNSELVLDIETGALFKLIKKDDSTNIIYVFKESNEDNYSTDFISKSQILALNDFMDEDLSKTDILKDVTHRSLEYILEYLYKTCYRNIKLDDANTKISKELELYLKCRVLDMIHINTDLRDTLGKQEMTFSVSDVLQLTEKVSIPLLCDKGIVLTKSLTSSLVDYIHHQNKGSVVSLVSREYRKLIKHSEELIDILRANLTLIDRESSDEFCVEVISMIDNTKISFERNIKYGNLCISFLGFEINNEKYYVIYDLSYAKELQVTEECQENAIEIVLGEMCTVINKSKSQNKDSNLSSYIKSYPGIMDNLLDNRVINIKDKSHKIKWDDVRYSIAKERRNGDIRIPFNARVIHIDENDNICQLNLNKDSCENISIANVRNFLQRCIDIFNVSHISNAYAHTVIKEYKEDKTILDRYIEHYILEYKENGIRYTFIIACINGKRILSLDNIGSVSSKYTYLSEVLEQYNHRDTRNEIYHTIYKNIAKPYLDIILHDMEVTGELQYGVVKLPSYNELNNTLLRYFNLISEYNTFMIDTFEETFKWYHDIIINKKDIKNYIINHKEELDSYNIIIIPNDESIFTDIKLDTKSKNILIFDIEKRRRNTTFTFALEVEYLDTTKEPKITPICIHNRTLCDIKTSFYNSGKNKKEDDETKRELEIQNTMQKLGF